MAQASWSVVLTGKTFGDAVRRLTQAGVDRFHEVPAWVNYWSFPVRDPMGTTVEITYVPEVPPANGTWA